MEFQCDPKAFSRGDNLPPHPSPSKLVLGRLVGPYADSVCVNTCTTHVKFLPYMREFGYPKDVFFIGSGKP